MKELYTHTEMLFTVDDYSCSTQEIVCYIQYEANCTLLFETGDLI